MQSRHSLGAKTPWFGCKNERHWTPGLTRSVQKLTCFRANLHQFEYKIPILSVQKLRASSGKTAGVKVQKERGFGAKRLSARKLGFEAHTLSFFTCTGRHQVGLCGETMLFSCGANFQFLGANSRLFACKICVFSVQFSTFLGANFPFWGRKNA